jgi:hypothetical protein
MDPQGIDTGGVKLGGKIRVKLTRNRSLVPTPWWKFWSRLFGRYIEAMECSNCKTLEVSFTKFFRELPTAKTPSVAPPAPTVTPQQFRPLNIRIPPEVSNAIAIEPQFNVEES